MQHKPRGHRNGLVTGKSPVCSPKPTGFMWKWKSKSMHYHKALNKNIIKGGKNYVRQHYEEKMCNNPRKYKVTYRNLMGRAAHLTVHLAAHLFLISPGVYWPVTSCLEQVCCSGIRGLQPCLPTSLKCSILSYLTFKFFELFVCFCLTPGGQLLACYWPQLPKECLWFN